MRVCPRTLFFEAWKILFLAGFLALMFPAGAGAQEQNLDQKIALGDQALDKGDLAAAEKYFTEALKLDPENFRIMHSLAQVKFRLEKYPEANDLIEKILAMPVITGKKVLVKIKGNPDPLEAELVDETVVIRDVSKNNMRNYLAPVPKKPIPHYRFFFYNTGKMELVPKHAATFQYMGVPRPVHDQVVQLESKVKNRLIAASGGDAVGEMVALDGGCFQMGSEKGAPDERPVHEVCVSAFKIDKYEVTQKAFQAQMGINPSRFKGADRPVEMVTWMEANAYCEKVDKRLPTEAEWEFAARGGTSTEYYWGDTVDADQANYCDRSCDLNLRDPDHSDGFKHTASVGSFPPNPYGLHDMAGNVSEWVADWMDPGYYRKSPKKDPKGPQRDTGVMRGGTNEKTVRGGAWHHAGSALRSAHRKGYWIDYRLEGLGFRCAADK